MCRLCGFYTDNQEAITSHLKKIHKGDPRFKSIKIDEKFYQRATYNLTLQLPRSFPKGGWIRKLATDEPVRPRGLPPYSIPKWQSNPFSVRRISIQPPTVTTPKTILLPAEGPAVRIPVDHGRPISPIRSFQPKKEPSTLLDLGLTLSTSSISLQETPVASTEITPDDAQKRLILNNQVSEPLRQMLRLLDK